MADATPPTAPEQPPVSNSSSSTSTSTAQPAPVPAASTRGRKRGASSTRAARAVRNPKFVGRRSKEERDALVQEALEQERARKAERDAAQRRESRGLFRGSRGRGRGERGRGRGGFMGDGPVSGPFSQGRSTAEMARRNQQASGFGGGPSGSRAHIKREIKGEEEEDAEMNRALGFTTKIKSEKNLQDGGYVSSDDDDDQYGPRLDIDAIDLSSGDDANDLEDKPKGSSIPRMLLPIRITRREHQDRVIGINTESSTVGLTKGSNSVEKKEGGSATEATDAASRKGKAKAKNVEITEDCKPYKGMWQDADESGGEVKINDEPVDDDAPITASEVAEAKLAMKEESPQLDMKSHLKGKGRLRRRSGALGSKPVLQTEEDKQEWERSQAELEDILVELGQTPQPATTTGVKDDDVDMKDGEQPRDVKSDRVYLFQFPPVLPALVPPSIKKEAQEETLIIATTDQTPIKVEDDDAKVPPPAAMTAGRVGKMRVHASGKVTLNWGGTSFEIKKGMSTHFLQDTVVTRIRPENERVMPGDEGDALAFGQVRGKFVVTPDWSAML